MMKIPADERLAIQDVLKHGQRYGYGNLISHLQTAWAKALIDEYGMDEKTARAASGGPGYSFAMQRDLIERGEWDETGARYAPPTQEPT